jgi:asparagine synthase (glutamine-hydrolysing)
MQAALLHETPLESGCHSFGELGVYAGWVAHRGSYAARQCRSRGADRTRLFFSGEVLSTDKEVGNERELTSLLRDVSSTRLEPLKSLNGLFSGLLVDPVRRESLLFVDRYGSERLYVAESAGNWYFASQASAILQVMPQARSFDPTGLAQFLAFSSTRGGSTFFQGIRLLCGGSLISFAPGNAPKQLKYFSPDGWEGQPSLGQQEFDDRFEVLLPAVIDDYLASDQAVGISLTGGLDTRMLMAGASFAQRPCTTYTYGGLRGESLDVRIASRVATALHLEHETLRPPAAFLRDFGDHVDQTVLLSDGHAGPLQAHELSLSKAARQLAPIRLTGNFGSEVLRNMSTLKADGPADRFIAPPLRVAVHEAVASANCTNVHPLTRCAFEEIPWHLYGRMALGRSQLTIRTPYLDNRLVELAYRAPSSSRTSAHASMEFLRRTNPELARIHTDRGVSAGAVPIGSALRRAWADLDFKLDYLYSEGLPHALSFVDPLLAAADSWGWLGRHKPLPYRRWFRTVLADYAQQVVTDASTSRLGIWEPEALRTLVTEHISGKRNNLREIHIVLTLEAIDRLFFRERPADVNVAEHAEVEVQR